MISDPKNLSEQLQNLAERLAIEMRTLNRTKVSTVNSLIPDNTGAVSIANATENASGLMGSDDKSKLNGIEAGANNYKLPTASSSQLGGVKTGSNITNTNGTISITSSNVTGALGYTPLKNAPVTSVNGKTGAVTVDVGVKTVNGTQPDPDGNVTIQTGGDTSNLVPKTGNRGVLAGFNTLNNLSDPGNVVINASTNDDTQVLVMSGATTVTFEPGDSGQSFVKQVLLLNWGGTITLSIPGDGSVLFDNASMSYSTNMVDLLVYAWYGDMGIIYTKQVM